MRMGLQMMKPETSSSVRLSRSHKRLTDLYGFIACRLVPHKLSSEPFFGNRFTNDETYKSLLPPIVLPSYANSDLRFPSQGRSTDREELKYEVQKGKLSTLHISHFTLHIIFISKTLFIIMI